MASSQQNLWYCPGGALTSVTSTHGGWPVAVATITVAAPTGDAMISLRRSILIFVLRIMLHYAFAISLL